MIYSRITGTGGYLPDKVLTNHDLEKMVDTSDEWIRERTGISKRHIAADGQNTVDLAEQASRRALEAAGRDAQDIDLIIVATTTPDRVFPSTACLLQKRLDRHGCAAFDIQAVCTGFVYALGVADKFVRTGSATCALVVGAETLSRVLNWKDRSTCVLFGDGAGAVVLEASDEPGILSTHLHADGAYEHLLSVPGGVSQGYDSFKDGNGYVTMKGNEVFKVAVNTLGRIVDETLEANTLNQTLEVAVVLKHGGALALPFAQLTRSINQGFCSSIPFTRKRMRTPWRSGSKWMSLAPRSIPAATTSEANATICSPAL